VAVVVRGGEEEGEGSWATHALTCTICRRSAAAHSFKKCTIVLMTFSASGLSRACLLHRLSTRLAY